MALDKISDGLNVLNIEARQCQVCQRLVAGDCDDMRVLGVKEWFIEGGAVNFQLGMCVGLSRRAQVGFRDGFPAALKDMGRQSPSRIKIWVGVSD